VRRSVGDSTVIDVSFLVPCSKGLAIVGLVANIVGTVMIFYFGAPPLRVTSQGGSLDVWVASPPGPKATQNRNAYRRHIILSRSGLILLGVGFALQLASLVVA
jgi:hypothetical protein